MPPRFSPDLFEKLYGKKLQEPERAPEPQPERKPETSDDAKRRGIRIYGKALAIASLIDQSIAIGIDLIRKPDGSVSMKAAAEDILANEMGCLMIVAKCYATRTSLQLRPDIDSSASHVEQREVMEQREEIRQAIEAALCEALASVQARVDRGEFE